MLNSRVGLCVVVTGAFLLGVYLRDRSDPPLLPLPLEAGSEFPSFVAHSPEGAVRIEEVLNKTIPTIVLVFSVECHACFGETEIWKELAKGGEHAFLALVFAPNFEEVSFFQKVARLPFPILLGDDGVRRRLKAYSGTTIFEVDEGGSVRFSATGETATSRLRQWLDASSPKT